MDTGAGISDNVLYFNLAAQERIVILTPEPTSLTDAYALIKVLKLNHGVERFRVVVNMARSEKEAKDIFKKLSMACDHFLSGVSLDLTGIVPLDKSVRQSVVNQIPFLKGSPDSSASRSVEGIALDIERWKGSSKLDGNIKFFWKKLLFQEASVA